MKFARRWLLRVPPTKFPLDPALTPATLTPATGDKHPDRREQVIPGTMPRPGRCAVLTLLIWSITLAAVAAAAPPNPADGALEETSWFDPERRTLLPVEVESTRDDTAHRSSRWEAQPKPTAPPPTGQSTGFRLFGLSLSQILAWGILAVTLFTLVGLLVYAFMKAEVDLGPALGRRGSRPDPAGDEVVSERIQQLPAELGRPGASDWRSESERAMREGRLDRASVLLFGHQLLLLDRAGILRLSRGKTNRCYLREARREDPPSAEDLQATVVLFERAYFGRHEITGEQFAAVWQRNEQLEQRLRDRQERAA